MLTQVHDINPELSELFETEMHRRVSGRHIHLDARVGVSGEKT